MGIFGSKSREVIVSNFVSTKVELAVRVDKATDRAEETLLVYLVVDGVDELAGRGKETTKGFEWLTCNQPALLRRALAAAVSAALAGRKRTP